MHLLGSCSRRSKLAQRIARERWPRCTKFPVAGTACGNKLREVAGLARIIDLCAVTDSKYTRLYTLTLNYLPE